MKKVAIIFGGSGGIGRAICDAFEKKGMTVYLTSHQRTAERSNPHILRCDITRIKDISNVISYVSKKEQKIDIVINSVTPPLKLKTVEELSIKEFRQDIDTILVGGINIAKTVVPVMKIKRNGIIINILSALVLDKVSTRMSSYISAKYGLLGFTKCLALELAPFNISVFGVSPSFVETRLIQVFPQKLIEMARSKRKNGKLIRPAEVAKLVLEIAQNPQKYKSGGNLEIE